MKKTLTMYSKVIKRAMIIAQVKTLVDVGLEIDAKHFNLLSEEPSSVSAAYEKNCARKLELVETMRSLEETLRDRMLLALRLLSVPSLAEQVEDAKELKERAEQYMTVAN